jgi:hypothetical protein
MDFSNPCAQEYIDSLARQYAAWGVDFLKIDGVGYGSARAPSSDVITGQYDNRDDLAAWNTAFTKAGTDVEIQLSWALDHAYVSDWQNLADSWRIEWDVECYCSTIVRWNSVANRFADSQTWVDWTASPRPNDGPTPRCGRSSPHRCTWETT